MIDQLSKPEVREADLMRATDSFAVDSVGRSWVHTWLAIAIFLAFETAAVLVPWWPLRLLAAVCAGVIMVRVFVIFHDVMHGAILRRSRFAQGLFWVLGLLLLTPPRSWRRSHNFHHGHVGLLSGSSTGSFPILTTEAWQKASFWQRLGYRIARHPLTLAAAYLTVFMYSICVRSLIDSPRRHWDSAVALLLHAGILTTLALTTGFAMLAYTILIPASLACAIGAYLFYVQHNFVGVQVMPQEEWTFEGAALVSSSYLELGPVMRFVTGNIGFHHVHHLNPRIPFYRLPATMAAVPPLRRAANTTLKLRDIIACLRLKLWDPKQQRMIGFRELRMLSSRQGLVHG